MYVDLDESGKGYEQELSDMQEDITEAKWNRVLRIVYLNIKCHCKVKKAKWKIYISVLIKIIGDCYQNNSIKLFWTVSGLDQGMMGNQ